MDNTIKLSVIIPTLNEVHHIENLVQAIYENDSTPKEVFIVDGGSTDGTREKVRQIHLSNPNVRLIENLEKYVSNGFNKSFQVSKGKYISLVGAHATYPFDYFKTCIEAIESGDCEAAGGFLNQCGKFITGQAIAFAMSSKFGVGNTEFRTIKKTMYVDSVAFAVYDRKVIEKVGLLDEDLIRNQDDEFHYRLNKAGFRIKMIHDLEITYYVRESLKDLYRQYYQYGLYKPLVLKKVRSSVRIRHLIPAFFVLYLFSLPISFFFPIILIPLAFYFLIVLLIFSKSSLPLKSRFYLFLVFPILHLSYGLGFLNGISLLWKQK